MGYHKVEETIMCVPANNLKKKKKKTKSKSKSKMKKKKKLNVALYHQPSSVRPVSTINEHDMRMH